MQIKQQHLEPVGDYSWNGNSMESIVFHTTLGSNYQGAYDTLKLRHLSYHYIIDADGSIHELVNIERSAWHAGVKHKPNLRVRSFFGDNNPNKRSIGIAFVRKGYEALTNEQRDAGVWLVKAIGARTGIRYTADNIFYHQEITDYKPAHVSTYRDAILAGLIGYRDDKDAKELTRLQMTIISLLNQAVGLLQKLARIKEG